MMIIKELKSLVESGRIFMGALPSYSAAEFSVYVRRTDGISEINLHLCEDGGDEHIYPLEWQGMSAGEEKWSVVFSEVPIGLYYYRYETVASGGSRFWGGEGIEFLLENQKRQLLVYKNEFDTPNKLRGAMIYHVFVDRFFKGTGPVKRKAAAVINEDWYNGIPQFGEYPGADVKNNEFFGGNLWGIVEKLDYIESLGTDYIYLSPVFDAASNHKYDTGDYLSVDEMFGGDNALRTLICEARKVGIGVILDGVFNHTGDDSIYFNRYGRYPTKGAYNSRKSKYYNWYQFHVWPDEYDCWWGVRILPRVDSSNSSYKSFICDRVAKKWMDIGVAGWRLDVVDELSDDFLIDFRSAVKEYNQDAFIIGEVWEDASNKEAYGKRRKYLQGDQLDSVMNYPFRDAVISYIKYGDCRKFGDTVTGICRRYPESVLYSLMNFLGTHDTARIITVLGGESSDGYTMRELSEMRMNAEQYSHAVRMVVCAYYLIGILPGTLSVYYGDEIGMEGYSDPFCRRPYPWGHENKTILSVIRTIGSIRKSENVFNNSKLAIIELNSDFALIARLNPDTDEAVVCAVNRSDRTLLLKSSVAFQILSSDKNKTARSIKVMSSDGMYIKFTCNFSKTEFETKLIP